MPSLLERCFKTKKYVSHVSAKGFVIDLRVLRMAEGNPLKKLFKDFDKNVPILLKLLSKPKNAIGASARMDFLLKDRLKSNHM